VAETEKRIEGMSPRIVRAMVVFPDPLGPETTINPPGIGHSMF